MRILREEFEVREMANVRKSSHRFSKAAFEITVDKMQKAKKERNSAALIYVKAVESLNALQNRWDECSDTSNQGVLKGLMNSSYRTFSYQKIQKAARLFLVKLQHVFLIVNDSPMRIKCWKMAQEVMEIVQSCDIFFYNIFKMQSKTESHAKFTIKKEKLKAEERIQGDIRNLKKLHDKILISLLFLNYAVPPLHIIEEGFETSKRLFQFRKLRYGDLIEPRNTGKPHFINKTTKFSKAYLSDLRKYVLKKESQKLVDSINVASSMIAVEQQKIINVGVNLADKPKNAKLVSSKTKYEKSLDKVRIFGFRSLDSKRLRDDGMESRHLGSNRPYSDKSETEAPSKTKILKNSVHLHAETDQTAMKSILLKNSRKRKFSSLQESKNDGKKAKLADG